MPTQRTVQKPHYSFLTSRKVSFHLLFLQNLLPVVTLGSAQFPFHCTQPVFCIHGVSRMGEGWRVPSHELTTLISWHLGHLHLQLGLGLLLSLLHGCQSLSNGLHCLGLHQEHLLH